MVPVKMRPMGHWSMGEMRYFSQTRSLKKTRPGADESAFKRSANAMAFPNSPSSNRDTLATFPGKPGNKEHPYFGSNHGADTSKRCLRCGPRGHFWENCPRPYRSGNLAPVSSKDAGKGGGESALSVR